MATYFPQINANGIAGPKGMSTKLVYRTDIRDMENGKRFTYAHLANPLQLVSLPFRNISDAELTVLKDFFVARGGPKEEFEFLNPMGNLVTYSEDFSNAAWTKTSVTVGAATTDPFGGNRATILTSSAASGTISTTVVPSGTLPTGFVLCLSLWARANGASQDIETSIVGVSSKVHVLPEGKWKRIHHTVVNTSGAILNFQIGGNSHWGSGERIDMWNVQCVSGPGPGPEMRTPAGIPGRVAKARFTSDSFEWTTEAPDNNRVTIVLEENK